ncbi:hypothetical protein [Iamia sp.]|uniref:hypothetical protein n=1 Tax=Iamia sp. TaxID=2722710 RepID=UPI002CA9F0EF|nr:hypothetical protein [Iamia sp.]HXH58763.1 hypothetical protein [Iamia sp.]
MDPLLRLVIDPSRPDGRAGAGNRVDARGSGHRSGPPRPDLRPPAGMRRILGAVGRILAPLAHALADDAAERAEVWGEGLTGTPAPRPRRPQHRP